MQRIFRLVNYYFEQFSNEPTDIQEIHMLLNNKY